MKHQKIGILPLARSTFDVELAEKKLADMLAALDATGHRIVGPRGLLFDGVAAEATMTALAGEGIDRLLALQVTFTDASTIVDAANRFDQPLSIWAVPEPRLGGRLRLNAFCGLNLASHALGLADRAFGWAYGDPEDVDLSGLLDGGSISAPATLRPADGMATAKAERVVAGLKDRRIGRIGAHPDGFATCAYDKEQLISLAGVEVDELELDDLFETAHALPEDAAEPLRRELDAEVSGLEAVDQGQLDRSLRLKLSLDALQGQGCYDAFALRCWPETFTEYGGAVCGPASLLGEARVPCACEADVYGALTQLILQNVAEAPVFLVDFVDFDATDDSAVVWHCGQAPRSMADPDAVAAATIHTNRKMPLLFEFPLKPGPVTFLRVSQARGQQQILIAKGEMLKRDMAFTGTSGVVRFDRPASEVLDNVMATGMEHHMALAYGDHTETLRGVAAALQLPFFEF